MKLNRSLIVFALTTFSAFGANASKVTEDSLLIRNVHIITAKAEISKQPLNVLIKNERISAIGQQEFSAAHVINGEGQYLIPGLIDTHVHLRDVPGLLLSEQERETSKIYQEAVAQIPKSYLYAGFTTVLDLINSKEFIEKWNSNPLAPQAYFCSPVFIPHGYPVALLPKEIQSDHEVSRHYLADNHSHATATIVDAADHTPAKLAAIGKKDGARCIKVFYETGFGSQRNLPVPSEAIVRELVVAAHHQKLPVFLHGNSQRAYEFALKTGVDMLVHGLWNGDATTTNDVVMQIANRLIKNGIAIQPTVQVIYGEQEFANPDFFKDPYLKQVMPASLINWYQSYEGQWMNRELSGHFKGDSARNAQQVYQSVKTVYEPLLNRVNTITQQLNQHKKSLLVFGSDTPSGPMYTQFPGFNGRKEMDHWLAMGISLADLFKAMTIGNARVMRLENEIGSIEKNKIANLLLLSKNPLEGVTAYDSIDWVILKGKAVKREDLSAMKN